MDSEKYDKVRVGTGFIAALDQSGGSTPKALKLYGINEDAYSNEEEMFGLVHKMRTRIITSPAFDGERIIGAILFEDTMDRDIEGMPTGDYLWQVKGVVPFLKIDQGLAEEAHGAQVMKPLPDLEDLLERAVSRNMFGTKMRSFIKLPGEGLDAVVEQQFAIAQRILRFGLVPIVEPEVDIHSPQKIEVEDQLTLPDTDDFYRELVEHPRVIRVLALSGGYSRAEANARLARNPGVIASFSRALTEGLTEAQDDTEFNAVLNDTIGAIATASRT